MGFMKGVRDLILTSLLKGLCGLSLI